MISSAQIRAGRAMLSIKQRDLANAAGVSLATLNNIERDLADPRSSTLGAIEKALERAGIECDQEKNSVLVRLHKQARPVFYEPFQASQYILNLLSPDALIHPKRLLFFCRNSDGVGRHEDIRLAVLIEGRVRDVLIDHAGLSMNDTKRAAETAGVIYAAMIRYGDLCAFHPTLLEDTTLSAIDEAIERLKQQDWMTLNEPFALLSLMKINGNIADEKSLNALTKGHETHPLALLIEQYKSQGDESPMTKVVETKEIKPSPVPEQEPEPVPEAKPKEPMEMVEASPNSPKRHTLDTSILDI